ncbi:transmembrane protein, putative (macronuclear) [Tetrahymena thermophila SB210]|uniref:Transmembrane protein, putative n=1 Tax=Tetrahymena thermophila (strain SB210) TaxID=312017 RepID=Q22NZ1_TETTS|nr:transmembrane protein, putative [Tetrahymena thermophila SB210]EAR87020.2 transmembrane protein, putative [Tetrahymena thermophila SB210]|eukprot:XP_001007265.2 transmembrane protein, putative [Tetrahymena thermophila SB210]
MALMSLISFAYIEFSTINNILSLILLLLVPIAYQASKILERIEIKNIVNSLSQIEQAKTSQLAKIMRLTFFQNRKYTDSEGIKILNGISKLQSQEKLNFLMKTEVNLPKQKNPNNLNSKTQKLYNEDEHYNISQKHTDSTDTNSNQLISESEMNQLISLIGDCFRRQADESKASHENLVDLSYLIYLLEIQQNFKLFWKQYCYETSISNQTSIKREQMMYSLLHSFERNLNSIQRQEKFQESIFSVNYLNVIMYDESIKESFSLLNQCINKKTSILQMMQMRIIDLNILSQKIEELQSQIEKLKQNIDFLHKLNGQNHEFTLLNTYYRNFLSFSRFDVQFDRYLHKNNRKKENEDNHNKDFNYYQCQYKSSVTDISELQNKNSCIIFTSLLNSAVQTIKKTSINFCKIFKMRNELAINKPIEILMPSMFKIAHPKYVKEFMENKNVFNNRVQNVVFGIKNDGYIFPCTVNVKVNRVDLFNDFGMTTLVKMINLSKDYILFNEQNLRIISITKNIHKYIFQSYKKFHTIFIDTYFPFINYKNLKQQSENQINSEAVISMNNFDELSLNNNNQINFMQQQFSFVFIEDNSFTELVKCHQNSVLENVQFYLIDIEIKKAQYKYIDNVYYIEISQLQELEPEKNYKIILQQLDSFLYESKRTSPIFKKILNQLKLIEQLSEDVQDNPFSIEQSSPRLVMSSLILKEHQKSSQEIFEINSPTLRRHAKSKYESLDNQKQDSIYSKNEIKFFSTEHNLESQSTGRECKLVQLSKKLRGVHSALQIFSSMNDKNKLAQQTQNTSRTVVNVNQSIQTDHQKLITENQNIISSPQEQVKNTQQIKLFKSTKQPNINKNNIPTSKKNDPIIKINDKQSQIDFSIINTLGLNNSLSINAAEEMVTINSIDEEEKNDIQQQRLAQIEQDVQKEEKIRQSRSTIRYIKDIMNQKIELNSIKVFQLIGILCFLILLILTVVQFTQLLSSINDFNLDFKLVNWPSTIQSQIASVQKNVSLNQINKQNDFVLVTKQIKSQINSYISSFMNEAVSDLHQTMTQMEGINSNRPIFDFLKDQSVVYSWPSFKYTGTQPDGKFYSVQYNTELHYGILLINLQILRYMADVGGGKPEYFMMVNEIVFQDAFKEVQQRAIQQSNKNLENIKNNLDNMLVITLILTTFCIGIQIPIYYFIQKERQNILYLFATFSTEITSKILSRLNSIYHQSRSTSMGLSTVFTKNFNNNIVNEQNEQNKHVQKEKKAQQNNDQQIKKQNISECKQLTRLDSSFLKKIFCIYILMIIFPILNKIIPTYYINQSINDANDIVQIQQLKAQILDSLGMNYYSLILKLYPNLKPFKIDWYMSRLNQIIINNDNMDKEIQNLINSQRDSYNYKKGDYDSTFFPIFQDDICLILDKKHQFNQTQLVEECQSCYNKVLTQGIILSFKKLNDQLKDFYNFFQIPNNTTNYQNERTFYIGIEIYVERPIFYDSTFLILLLVASFSWKFADKIQNKIQVDLISNISNRNELSIKQLDNIIRLDFFQTGDCNDYLSINLLCWVAINNSEHEKENESLKNNKIQIEQQLLLFHQKLKSLNKSSKQNFDENQNHPRQLLANKEIDQIVQMIGNRFRDILETEKIKQKQSDCQILYLIYILEIQKNFKLFLLQYYQTIQNKKNINLKRRQILQTLFIRFQDYLQQYKQQNSNQDNIFSMKYFNFILYDETINENIQLFSKTITKKNDILFRMQAKIIDLDSLSYQIKDFLSMKQKLEETIILLSKLNMNNKEFKVILNHFNHCLAFDHKEISVLKKQIFKQQKQENESTTAELIQSIDSSNNQDSCVIFTSLLNNEGKHVIKKASTNFYNLFGIKCKQVIQKPIEYLMPEVFKPYHSIYIKDFMERNIKFNYQIQNIAFAKDSFNYIFPCSLILKINSIDSIQDFGITAQIRMIQKHKDYILFNSTSMRIISITQNLHKIIFKHFKQLENINLSQYFPFIQEAINPTGKLFSQSLSSFSLSSAEENLQTGSSDEEGSIEYNAFLNKPIQFIFLELIDRIFSNGDSQISQIQILDPFVNPLLIMYHLDTELYSNLKYSKNELIQNVKIQLKEVSQQLNSEEQLQFHQELNQSINNDSKSSRKMQKSKDSGSNSSSSSSVSSPSSSDSKSEKNLPKATIQQKNSDVNQSYQIKVNNVDSCQQSKNKQQEYKKSFLSLKFEASQEQILNFRKNKTSSLSEISKNNDKQEEINITTGVQQSQIIEEIFTPKSSLSQKQNNSTLFLGLTDRQNSSSPKQMNYDLETNSQFDQSRLLSSPRSKVDKFVQIVQDHKLKNFIKKKFQTILSKVKQTQDQFYQKQAKSSKRSFLTGFIKEDYIQENMFIDQDDENNQKTNENVMLNQRREIKFIRDAMKSKFTITVGNKSYFVDGKFKQACRNRIFLETRLE